MLSYASPPVKQERIPGCALWVTVQKRSPLQSIFLREYKKKKKVHSLPQEMLLLRIRWGTNPTTKPWWISRGGSKEQREAAGKTRKGASVSLREQGTVNVPIMQKAAELLDWAPVYRASLLDSFTTCKSVPSTMKRMSWQEHQVPTGKTELSPNCSISRSVHLP